MWRYVYSEELYHHGIKGMKWYQRRFQREDGSLTPLGKIRYHTNSDFKKEADRKKALAKARIAKAEKKKAAEEETKKQAAKQAEKERILKSGTADEVMKIAGDLTQEERNSAYNRIQWEGNMKRYTTQQETVKAGEEKTKDFFDKLGDATVKAEKGIKAYNTAANIINAFNGERVMPKIDTNIQNANKDAVIKRRKDLKAERAGQKEMPKYEDVIKNINKYDNDTLNAWAKKKSDTDEAHRKFKEAFEGKPKDPTVEEMLANPSKYTTEQFNAAKNRKNAEDEFKKVFGPKEDPPSVDDMLRNPSKYSTEQLNAAKNRKDAEDNFRKTFTTKIESKTPSVSDILRDPDKYTDAEILAAKNRKNNLDSLSGKNGGKGKGMSESEVEELINRILDERDGR